MKSPSSFPDNLVYLSVCTYLFAHIREPLSVARICRDNRIGRSQLERLFLAHTGNGVMHSFSLFKISAAKQLLVRRDLNVASAGKFSSDRTIEEYVEDIWHLDKVMLPQKPEKTK